MKLINTKLMAILAVVAMITTSAKAIDITIGDTYGGTYFGTGGNVDDQETEPGTVGSQVWDLEAFTLTGSTLNLIGGFDFKDGVPGYPAFVRGDIFINTTGLGPVNPIPTDNVGLVKNGPSYNYEYAIRYTFNADGSKTFKVYALTADTMLETAAYDFLKSNPYKYSSGGTVAYEGTFTYASGLNDAAVAAYGAPVIGGSHNVVSIDLAPWLSASQDVLFHTTMGCGNDNLMGRISGGFQPVPDGGMTLALLGLGMGVIGMFGRRFMK
jgi:hypothetical protein